MGDAARRGENTPQTNGGMRTADVAAPRGHTRSGAEDTEVAAGPWGRALAYHC